MANVSTEGRTGGDEVPPSIAVVEAVAAHDGVDASTLDPPLNTVVDGDALDSLFAGRDEDPNAAVAFTFRGHLVEVAGDGAVVVDADDSAGDDGSEHASARAGEEDACAEAEQEGPGMRTRKTW